MKLSKAVLHGMLVYKRGDKWIRCPKNRKPHGVFERSEHRVVINMKGVKEVYNKPAGVTISGNASVLVK